MMEEKDFIGGCAFTDDDDSVQQRHRQERHRLSRSSGSTLSTKKINTSARQSFRDHIGLAEQIHRKSMDVREMHQLLVERLKGMREKEENERRAEEEEEEECCDGGDRFFSSSNDACERQSRRKEEEASLFAHSPMTSLRNAGRRRPMSDAEEDGNYEEEEDTTTTTEREMIKMLQESKAERSVAELMMLEEEEEDIFANENRRSARTEEGEETTMVGSSLLSPPSSKQQQAQYRQTNNNTTTSVMSPNSNGGTSTFHTGNKKKSAATETDYLIDIENLKKERNELKRELAELGEDVEYHRMASAASRIECDNNEDEKQRLEIEVQDLEIEIREVENRLTRLRVEMQQADQEASCKIAFLKELDHEQEEAERELEHLKESCLEEERKMEEKLAEREAVEEALHSLRGELEEEKMWKAQFLDEVREAERQAEDATMAMKNANEKTRIERKNCQLYDQKRRALAEECEKLLEMKRDIETFLDVKAREDVLFLDETEVEEDDFPVVNDEEKEQENEEENTPDGTPSSASTFSTPGKDSDYTQYSPDSPLPPQHHKKSSLTPKQQNGAQEQEAFTPGGSVKTSPRVTALIEKAAKSPLRANVGNGIAVEEEEEEGRADVRRREHHQQQDLLLSPWLMTFEDTPPEKKQNLIDLKTPPAPREESYESVRLQAEFIKMQQNAATAAERKKQNRSSGKPSKKVGCEGDQKEERELATLREQLETQERRLRELESLNASKNLSQQQHQRAAKKIPSSRRECEERKIEARVRLLRALQLK